MPIALEQPKRPVGGGYGVFVAEKRPEFQKQCAGKPVSAVAKLAGETWAKMTDDQKAPYMKKYEANKVQFDKDMKAFLAKGGEVTKGACALRTEKRKAKDGKKKKDPNAPKKPTGGGYGMFLAENRAKITKSLPAGHKITDVTKAAGDQWRVLSETQKKPYNDMFLKKQEEYQVAFAEYKKNLPEDAEDDEEEEDNEEEEEEEEEQPAPKKARK
eukprot:gnl/MRDRNA2_/MRDRNA2_85760_c0_seq1.p1 gnl/MRDRNA2_/MRDRNA2_85760_c0~~gnl/MRDRNA2_/MRDRNA2_85760_c0_seq1.p1  ORF type:complete len:246 (+),score=93.12 gnl/MRDRNA2_/MRDRNA2_85760_c0_seq1:98-739(+)